ncbi:hypothetical protein [Gynuella sp.]|uniref:hypothetical protein n=1 Tax=Gynuella sp. TaxID=2969146 RepID=UPI003D0F4A63
MQSDLIGLGGGLNTYAYVDNDPLNYFDIEGESKKGWLEILFCIAVACSDGDLDKDDY